MNVRELGVEFFERLNRHDPLGASLVGLTAYDALLPDPHPSADRDAARHFRATARSAASASGDDIDRAVLRWMADTAADEAEHCLWEANASAMVIVSPQSSYFTAGGEQRLPGAAAFFDGLADRYRDASARGRPSTRAGLAQAAAQLEGYLLRPGPADVRAAMRSLADCYTGELSEVARDDEHVGISEVRGGEAGYRAAVAAHTTLPMTPREVHDLGLELLADLETQWSSLGREAFGSSEPAAVRARLRDDPALRCASADEILQTVAGALKRAEALTPEITALAADAPCHVEAVPPEDADSAPAGYYRPPAVDGSQPGTVFILTAEPEQRSRFALEALTYHEAVPGHHFQAVAAQGRESLPDFRRYVDTRLGAYVEGWALYAEQLADDLGLYSSPLARLGRVSMAALRAARLVTDTGLHAFGWSRQQAGDFLRDSTVLSERDVRQEADRYIAWPGQALAYSVGAREILRLRETARTALGSRYRPAAFHDQVLGAGAVPMPVLSTIIDRWVTSAR
ncbi:DUF885 domain-containing protein [Actinoplanes derwentensis]|uniref:DUF885 domain-containing protein n=1 Tax=Actinoplanes derwentensis TaxID=113562 RepID=A0A1H1YLK7_9ACTN|nr:DUF885 domain-containing protein [Actinoplanes derwentensis]GID81184.1 hypothetical protein Ade03nite_01080 [Actinoplanes derwentensis]SDT21936.1 protein of unknown function [Actinoplanes derwentensis]